MSKMRRLIVQVASTNREELIEIQTAFLDLVKKKDLRFRVELDEEKVFKVHREMDQTLPQQIKTPRKRQFNNPVSDNPPVNESVATPEEKEMLVDHNLPKPNGGKPKPDWTEEDLRSAVQEIWKIPNGGQVAAQDLMKKYHINRVSQIPEDRWSEFMSEATMVIVNLREKKN